MVSILLVPSVKKSVASGYHDALMLDYRGYIAECSGANIFFVQNGVVCTCADCFLDGITRRTVVADRKKVVYLLLRSI